jgi:F-type H+-transporting ATPase subunit epsilon
MASTLTLRIITPDRIVLEREVDQVIARAIDGDLAILPNHQPLLTALDIDVLRFTAGKEEHTAAVMGGIMEVNRNEVTVLSDLAELDTEIDETLAHQEKERAEAEKTQKTDKLDVYITEMAISRSIARLRAVEVSRRRRGHRHDQ